MQTSPAKAIREYCLQCCLENSNEVRLCPAVECPLHAFRFGKNPYIKRTYTAEQKEEMAERLRLRQKSNETL